MKITASALLIGAAAVTALPGHVTQGPGERIVELPNGQHLVQGSSGQHILGPNGDRSSQAKSQQVVDFDAMSVEQKAIWDEISMLYPEQMKAATQKTSPKKHTRRPSSYWDHITSGADIQSVWVENAEGVREREIDGKLEDYSLRTKKVDPSALGVDPGVKQYSGYLDDDKEDKHLFYCQ